MSSVIHIEPTTRPALEEQTSLTHCSAFLIDIWRRIRMELVVEFPLLKYRWKTILLGALFQYVHGIFTQLEKRLHQPQSKPLGDMGFEMMHELGRENAWVSESIFYTLFISFILWILSPFVVARKRFYTVVLLSRLLTVLATCQALRIISFLSTQLPAPNYHCRLGEETANLEWPKHWYGHIIINPAQQAAYGCGDLIFSSHTTFILVGILTYTTYGSLYIIKIVTWILGAVLSLLIIASRKHYTVDIVVAWYTVPLVFYTFHRRWTTKRDMGETSSIEDDRAPSDVEEKSTRDHLLQQFKADAVEHEPYTSAESSSPTVNNVPTVLELHYMEEGSPLAGNRGAVHERPAKTLMVKTGSALRLDDF